MASKRKPNGYWDDFSNLERELLAFIEERGTPGVMPTASELIEAGRSDLASAVNMKHGGYLAVTEKLGLNAASTAKPPGYWKDFSNLECELLDFIEEHGNFGVIPTQRELQKVGRSSLAFAIHKHGGFQLVAQRLGLTYAHKRHGYWQDFANVKHELLAFIEECGTPGVMPTDTELRQARRSQLSEAISKHGGFGAVAQQLGLEFTYIKKKTAWLLERFCQY